MVPAPQQPRACMYPLMSGKVRDKAMPAPLSDGLCVSAIRLATMGCSWHSILHRMEAHPSERDHPFTAGSGDV
jgi:hypothetical protein